MAVLIENMDLNEDRETLLEVRDILDKRRSLNWSMEIPVDRWVGVTVSRARVTELRLEEKQLSGTIPAEFARLSQLQKLILRKSNFSGSIPPDLGKLAMLKDLSLDSNNLEGIIPDSIGRLLNLRRLFLGKSQLRGKIPSRLGNLSRLEKLSLKDNQLIGPVPSSLGRLSKLRLLSLGGNMLQGSIPGELGNLGRLEVLSLRKNQLTGNVPTSLGNLENLRVLTLDKNLLKGGIPDEIEVLPELKTLSADFITSKVNKSSTESRAQVVAPSEPPLDPEIRQESNREEVATKFFTYILKLDGGEFYIGQTRELRERLMEHRDGLVKTTSGKSPKLVWFTTVSSRKQSVALESELYRICKRNPRIIRRMVRSLQDLVEQLDFS